MRYISHEFWHLLIQNVSLINSFLYFNFNYECSCNCLSVCCTGEVTDQFQVVYQRNLFEVNMFKVNLL